MSKNKTPKFKERDDRYFQKKKSNRPKEPYVRSNDKRQWEDYLDEEREEEKR